jgi:hypothetical protein
MHRAPWLVGKVCIATGHLGQIRADITEAIYINPPAKEGMVGGVWHHSLLNWYGVGPCRHVSMNGVPQHARLVLRRAQIFDKYIGCTLLACYERTEEEARLTTPQAKHWSCLFWLTLLS